MSSPIAADDTQAAEEGEDVGAHTLAGVMVMTSAVTADAGKVQSLGEIEGGSPKLGISARRLFMFSLWGHTQRRPRQGGPTKGGQHEEPLDHRL